MRGGPAAVADAKGGGMAEGTIQTIRDDRGFGFIRADEGQRDLFFREGQRVEYEEGPDERDPRRNRATRLRPLEA
jgi:cold shock CspA family protein